MAFERKFKPICRQKNRYSNEEYSKFLSSNFDAEQSIFDSTFISYLTAEVKCGFRAMK